MIVKLCGYDFEMLDEVQEHLDIDYDGLISVDLSKDGEIIIKKHIGGKCVFCSRDYGLISFKSKFICASCIEDIEDEI